MAQIFHPSMNTVARVTIFGAVFVIAALGWLGYQIQASPYVTQAGIVRDQPVPFSHEHHVRGLGIDCRYCHTGVETSAFAGMPPTETCMTCHSKVWTNAAVLEPIRQSWRTQRPVQGADGSIGWTRVDNLPDFVYFDHHIHINKGVGCSTCHGEVDRMPLMFQKASLQMEWCLSCHRDPEKEIRPRDEVFNMNWQPPVDQEQRGRDLVAEYHVNKEHLTSCYVCHR